MDSSRITPIASLLLALLPWPLLAAGCGDSGPASAPTSTPGPSAPPALIRLWTEVEPIAPASAAGAAGATPGDASQDAARVVLSAAAARAASWDRLVAQPGAGRLALAPFTPGDAPFTLSRDQGLAALLPLPATAAEALSVRVTLRWPASAEAPRALLVELPQALRRETGLSPDEFQVLCDPERVGTHVLSAVPGAPGAPVTLQADFVLARLHPQLVLFLIAPTHTGSAAEAVAVEAVQVSSLSLVDYVASGRPFSRLAREPGREAVSLTLDRDRRQSLLALPGRRYEFALPSDSRPRRLDLALGVAPRDASLEGAVRLTVEADGATLLEERLTAPRNASEPAWRDVSLPLPAGARRLVLSAAGEGADPPLAAFGQPTLRAASASAPGRPPFDRRFNVVMISLDTLRPDRLGCYGASPSPSPRIDALALQGLRFANAYSTSSYTLPAHGSLFTGQYPAVHGAVDPADRLDAARSPFLARMLADAGYVTAAFTAGAYLSADFGFSAGFDRYSHNDPVWSLESTRGKQLLEMGSGANAAEQAALLRRYATPMLVQWIERQSDGVPFFLFAHTYVVHNYAPDRGRLKARGLLDEAGREARLDETERDRFNFGEAALRDRLVADYLPYYDATIEMADDFVGALLDALDRAGLAESTIVVVLSDHGEEFGEHGYFGHGKNLYDSNVRVPLVVRLPPDAQEPGVVDELVSLVDVAPFVLRSVGLQPDPRMSLGAQWDATRSVPPARERVVMELDTTFERVSAVREGDLKLSERTAPTKGKGQAREKHKTGESGRQVPAGPVGGTAATPALPPKIEVFDISRDAGEREALSTDTPDAAQLRQQLESFLLLSAAIRDRLGQLEVEGSVLDPQAYEQLIQMGYVEAPTDPPAPKEPGRDAK